MKNFVMFSLFIVTVSMIVPTHADKIPDAEMKQAEQEFNAVKDRLEDNNFFANKDQAALQAKKAIVKFYILKALSKKNNTKLLVKKHIEDFFAGNIGVEAMGTYLFSVTELMGSSPEIKEYVDSLLC